MHRTIIDQKKENAANQAVHFLLLPGFSLMEYSNISSVFLQANQFNHENRMQYTVDTIAFHTIVESDLRIAVNCRKVQPSQSYSEIQLLIILSPNLYDRPETLHHTYLFDLLKYNHQTLKDIIAIGNSVDYLLKNGILKHHKYCVISWWNRFPELIWKKLNIQFKHCIFFKENNITTVAGGLAGIHWALHWVEQQCSRLISIQTAEHLLIREIYEAESRQRIPTQSKLGHQQPKLSQAILLMEAHLEKPLRIQNIAAKINLSQRQLERLFKEYLGNISPSQYYLKTRLEAGHELLRKSSLPSAIISSKCGFLSSAHFSTAYRNHFGCSPRDTRLLLKR